MIHYRDMTFCRGDGCIKFDTCPRALTPAVQDAARKWWGEDERDEPPISVYVSPMKLDCWEPPSEGDPFDGDEFDDDFRDACPNN